MSRVNDHCDQFVADCRVRRLADLFAHTWNPVVLLALRDGPLRRGALREQIGGISDKVLTDTLRRLRDSGLVARRAYAEAPPRVDYALTRLGESVVDGPLRALGAWVSEHGDELTPAPRP
jgi:DNA-binding HxlR family transcriptional regulator